MTSPPTNITVRIEPMGCEVAVQPGESLLEAALRAGVQLPRSCRNGTCRACLCRLTRGDVRYRTEWPGVSADERAAGWILPCVAEPVASATIVVPGAWRTG